MATENPNTNQQNYSDEIDLRQLFSGIGQFFANIFNGILWFIIAFKNATWRYRKLFIIILIPVALAAIAFKYTARDYYQSSIILKNNYTNNSLMFNNINKLNTLCAEENYEELARVLKVPLSTAEQIKNFDYAPLITEEDLVGMSEMTRNLLGGSEIELDENAQERIQQITEQVLRQNQTTFRVFVYVYDYSIILDLEEPVVNYFKSSNYTQRRLTIDRENLEARQQKIDENLSEMDSLKNLVVKYFASLSERSREGSNNIILAEDRYANPLTVFNEHDKLYQRKLDVKKSLYLDANFEVIDGFTVFAQPVNPGLIKLGAYSVAVSLALFYLIILLLEINIYLNEFERRRREKKAEVA